MKVYFELKCTDCSIIIEQIHDYSNYILWSYNFLELLWINNTRVLTTSPVFYSIVQSVSFSIKSWHQYTYFFKRFLKFIFGERGREGEKHQCVVASRAPPTGDLAHNPGTCPVWEWNRRPFVYKPALNPLSHTSQDNIHILLDGFIFFYSLIKLLHFIIIEVLNILSRKLDNSPQQRNIKTYKCKNIIIIYKQIFRYFKQPYKIFLDYMIFQAMIYQIFPLLYCQAFSFLSRSDLLKLEMLFNYSGLSRICKKRLGSRVAWPSCSLCFSNVLDF